MNRFKLDYDGDCEVTVKFLYQRTKPAHGGPDLEDVVHDVKELLNHPGSGFALFTIEEVRDKERRLVLNDGGEYNAVEYDDDEYSPHYA